MSRQLSAVVVGSLLVLAGSVVQGHHSVQSQFDVMKPIMLRGQVAQVEWRRPHVLIRLRVANEKAGGADWLVETLNPQGLERSGVDVYTLKSGDVISVSAFVSRDGRRHAVTQTMTLPNGKTVSVGVGAGNMTP